MSKEELINKLEGIVNEANSHDNGFAYKLVVREWTNYGKSRSYFKIVETRENSKHYVEGDYGFFDNIANEYVPGKKNIDFNFGGNIRL